MLQLLSQLFLYKDTTTTKNYTLSLHDALPISGCVRVCSGLRGSGLVRTGATSSGSRFSIVAMRSPNFFSSSSAGPVDQTRSEEHTSELQSRLHLVCRLLLEKKKERIII